MRKLLAIFGVGGMLLYGATEVPLVPATATQGIVQGNAALIASLQIYWNTPDGTLAVNQYGLDETGKNYWAHYPTGFLKVPLSTDMTGMVQMTFVGQRGVDYYTSSSGTVSTQVITSAEYAAEAAQTTPKTTTVLEPLATAAIANAATVTIIGGSDTGALHGGNPVTSDTYSVTVASGGQNEVFVAATTGQAPVTGTLGGTTMSAFGQGDGLCQYENVLYLVAPTTGVQNLVTTYGGSWNTAEARGVTIQDSSGLDTKAFIGTSAVSSISTTTTTTADGDIVFATLTTGGGATTHTNSWSATDIMTNQGTNNHISMSWLAQTTAGAITASYSLSASDCPGLEAWSFKYVAPPAVQNSDSGSAWFMLL